MRQVRKRVPHRHLLRLVAIGLLPLLIACGAAATGSPSGQSGSRPVSTGLSTLSGQDQFGAEDRAAVLFFESET